MSLCPLRLALPPAAFAAGPLLAGILEPSSPPPPPPSVSVVSIASLTGDGSLVGWSDYDHSAFDPAAPLKYKARTFAGSLTELSYTGPDATGDVIYYQAASYPYAATGSLSVRWEGTATRDETGALDFADRYETAGGVSGFDPETGPYATSSLSIGGLDSASRVETLAPGVKTLCGVGTVNDTRLYAPRGSFDASGTATETLSNLDTVFDALTRAAVTPGTLDTTEPGTFDTTAPESYSDLAFTGVTTVRVTGRLIGGEVGSVYGVRAALALAQIMPPALSVSSAWIDVTCTDAAETSFTFDVPISPNFQTRFTGFFL